MKLSVVTPEKRIVTDIEVEDVTLPGYLGELNVLPGHAPLMTTLTTGVVEFRRIGAGSPERVAVSWGYCEVANDVVNILAETAEAATEIDVSRAELALKKSEKKMELPEDSAELDKYRSKRERAAVRIAVARMN